MTQQKIKEIVDKHFGLPKKDTSKHTVVGLEQVKERLVQDLTNLDNWISIECIENCQQDIRYLLKHQNYPMEEDMSDYQKGFTVACELAEEGLEDLLPQPPKQSTKKRGGCNKTC